MRMFRLTILVARPLHLKNVFFLLCLGLASCESNNASYEQLNGNAQGSTFKIIYEPQYELDLAAGIDEILEEIDKSMSLWDSTSVIVAVNESTDSTIVDKHFKKVFIRSEHFHKISKGAFEPTLAPLISAWGFARKNDLELPKDYLVDSLRTLVGLKNFVLSGDILIKQESQARIDLNAIAQGYTVDVIGDYLDQFGIANYLIELGGEIKTKGYNQFERAWKVGIERPDFNSTNTRNAIKTVVGLSDVSLATSGSYRKFYEIDGKKYSHTLDPQTGKPVLHNLLSVSVIAVTAMDADAYATMFMVMGKDSAIAFSDRNNLKIQCIYDEDGTMKIQYSKGFKELVIQEN